MGLANSQRTPSSGSVNGITGVDIITSYATGPVTGASGAEIGGLVGAQTTTATPSGSTGSSNIGVLNSYWDTRNHRHRRRRRYRCPGGQDHPGTATAQRLLRPLRQLEL